MDAITSPRKKIRSPVVDTTQNTKTSITCTNVPEGLFDAAAAKKHFSKFGKVQKIRLIRKKQMCIVEYELPTAMEKAVLNAGAYDGFMFDVVRTKPRVRRRSSRKEDDPDWLPDSDVEEELSAMSGTPTYRLTRQKPMEIEPENSKITPIKRMIKNSPIKGKAVFPQKKPMVFKNPSFKGTAFFQVKKPISQPTSGIESPVVVTAAQTSMSTSEAAAELNQLRIRVSLTPDEQWRTLDARDRILRAWGGAGSRVKMGGATIGTCPDMCPEKELLHRQAEHQVMTLETVPESDGQLDPLRAVKQYSRSSADQEIPMCYELRPAPVLMRTCAYLLNEVADTKRQVSLADWFHFMWDRLRGIRKDITQQALCCSESIWLVEMCARFHAHCAARLADLEYSQFDQKLNTDNLTKCLQTLKHMYADVGPEKKPNEAEFRGYIALLNLGDANFLWEIKQLPVEIQKAEPIKLAIQVFNALDNNNYVRFFRLVRDNATYLQACILLRYFNDVRARALARIVKAYSPRGGSRYPAEELMNSLAFESIESMKSFINHYGLRIARDESELSVILDRNQFIEDMDPFPIGRAIHLIESKRTCTVGQVIAGGQLPSYKNFTPYSSFTKEGKLKETALVAEDQGYNTVNDSNKNVHSLKDEIQRVSQGGRYNRNTEANIVKPEKQTSSPGKSSNVFVAPVKVVNENKSFSFKPAIPVAPVEEFQNSPEKILSPEKVFSFSKPNIGTNLIVGKEPESYKSTQGNNFFSRHVNENVDPANSLNIFKKSSERNETKTEAPKALFESVANKNLFLKKDGDTASNATFKQNSDINKPKSVGSIFSSAALSQEKDATPQSIFGAFNKPTSMTNVSNIFTSAEKSDKNNSVFPVNGDASAKLSPGSLFKSATNSIDNKGYSIFQSKNKPSTVAENILNSVNAAASHPVYDFNENDDGQAENNLQQLEEERKLIEEQERKLREKIEEEKRQELRRIEALKQEEERRKEQERRKLEEIKRLEEIRKREEEKRQEELKKKLEAEKKEEELKRKAEEERKFKERVDLESSELCSELIDEVRSETVKEILVEEVENMKRLTTYAENVTQEIWTELSDEISASEMKAEKLWTDKLMKKWFYIWRKQFLRNSKRRNLLENTPVWLTERTPIQEAAQLKRKVENAALENMNAFHRGYIFSGEFPKLPSPEPYNIMEIIKSPLLKRMKQINYPYDKCFFWKITLVSPSGQWMYRKIDVEKWLLDVFSDKQSHETSETLIHVGKQSWNSLMDFAISVSLLRRDYTSNNTPDEAMEGSNGLLFYYTDTENLSVFVETIHEALRHKYPYQKVPVAVVMPNNEVRKAIIEHELSREMEENVISDFKIFTVEPVNVFDSLNACTKSAMKWLAKKYPPHPPLEVDYLKSICERYLASEIWSRFKSEKDCRMNAILKDLTKLVRCYNTAVDKLAHAITNEDLFNYPMFPLEFKQYLNHNSPYPKPYEFIPASARNSNNISVIKDTLNKLKLPDPATAFQPLSIMGMHDQIREYCNQIGWFDNTEQVVCKIVAVLPNQFSELDTTPENFTTCFENYDLAEILNILVYEKINRLSSSQNCHVVYEKAVLQNFRDTHWIYEIDVMKTMKHKVLRYEDELDMLIEAKRRKIEIESMDYLMLEENDCTMIEENLKASDASITKYSDCSDAVKQLEERIEEERQKSRDLENLLKKALSNV